MKMLIARFHTLIASWLLATVLPSNFMLGGNFFALKKPHVRFLYTEIGPCGAIDLLPV